MRSKLQELAEQRSEKALAWIGALYEIDRRAEGDGARLAELRRTDAPAVLAELKTWLWELGYTSR